MKPGALRAAYNQFLQQPGFHRDRNQERAIGKLEHLQRALTVSPREFDFWARRMLRLLPGKSAIEPVRGLYLWGSVGRGKTMLMDLFHQTLPFPERARMHFHRFMHEVHEEMRKLRSSPHPLETVAHRLARRARVICFDEFQVTDIADAMILGTLLDALFRRGVTLVATSNTRPGDLYRQGLQRQRFLPSIALIEKHTDVVHLEGATDYRLRELRRIPIYLGSHSPDTQPRLEHLFATVAGEAGAPGGYIVVEHRHIKVVRRAEGVCWFEFHELCEGPRSPEDYIELACAHHTIFLSRVPTMDESADNAARRFIALVDELYDRNVNLIVSAAAGPEALYRGRKLRFEFQRTASRLAQMQSEEYLARPHEP